MFPIDRLPAALLRTILDHLGFRELITLQRVNKSFRATINARGLFPKKGDFGSTSLVPCGHEKRASYEDAGKNEIWAHEMSIFIEDLQGWYIKGNIETNGLIIGSRDGWKTRAVPFDRFLELMPRMRTMLVQHWEPHVNSIDLEHENCKLIDVSPFYRWLASSRSTLLGMDYDITTWNLLRKIRLNYRGDVGELHIYAGRVDAVPWNDASKIAHDLWRGRELSRSLVPTIRFDCLYSFEGVALLGDIALSPERLPRRGLLHHIEANRDWANNEEIGRSESLLKSFAERLRRKHNGIMECVDGADAETLHEWMDILNLERYGTEYVQQFCRIYAYGKYFLVCFAVSSCHEVFNLCIFDK